MATQQHNAREVDTDRIRALAERAARVQSLLGDLELALLPAGESPALKMLRNLKGAWREFRRDARRAPPSTHSRQGPILRGRATVSHWMT